MCRRPSKESLLPFSKRGSDFASKSVEALHAQGTWLLFSLIYNDQSLTGNSLDALSSKTHPIFPVKLTLTSTSQESHSGTPLPDESLVMYRYSSSEWQREHQMTGALTVFSQQKAKILFSLSNAGGRPN